MREPPTPDDANAAWPSLGQAARLWLRIGLLSFGGPAAQIAMLDRAVVAERRWVSEARFLHALNFCMLLPGPEAQQLATYLGWLMHGVRGGLVAGLLFILPGALVMLGLSFLYVLGGGLAPVASLFLGLQAAVLAVVAEALLRVARRALRGRAAWALALAAFLALALLRLPFPVVVLAAAALGALAPAAFGAGAGPSTAEASPALIDRLLAADPGRPARLAPAALRAGLLILALWLGSVLLLLPTGLPGQVALFFSQLAVVTFGGAYAVLAHVAQSAVEVRGWLTAEDMLTGLGLAETTPGPLILVLQFVGFMAGWRESGTAAALVGSLVALWATFAPCFAWIFLGAPFMERLRGVARLRGALAGISAAVVGVIGSLALWFGLRVLFGALRPVEAGPLRLDLPVLSSLDPVALALAAASAVALLRLHWGVVPVLALAAGGGVALRWLLGA